MSLRLFDRREARTIGPRPRPSPFRTTRGALGVGSVKLPRSSRAARANPGLHPRPRRIVCVERERTRDHLDPGRSAASPKAIGGRSTGAIVEPWRRSVL